MELERGNPTPGTGEPSPVPTLPPGTPHQDPVEIPPDEPGRERPGTPPEGDPPSGEPTRLRPARL